MLLASDIDDRVLELASRNLSLLTSEGLSERRQRLSEMAEQYGKDSHNRALQSAGQLMKLLRNNTEERREEIGYKCFKADAATSQELEAYKGKVHMVITDLPYGELVQWSGNREPDEALERLLSNLLRVLSPAGIVAVITQKKLPVSHPGFKRVERFNAGKRQIVLLEPAPAI